MTADGDPPPDAVEGLDQDERERGQDKRDKEGLGDHNEPAPDSDGQQHGRRLAGSVRALIESLGQVVIQCHGAILAKKGPIPMGGTGQRKGGPSRPPSRGRARPRARPTRNDNP